jgi:hypothetical protein
MASTEGERWHWVCGVNHDRFDCIMPTCHHRRISCGLIYWINTLTQKRYPSRTSRAMQPLPAALFETISPNSMIHPVCIFRPRG